MVVTGVVEREGPDLENVGRKDFSGRLLALNSLQSPRTTFSGGTPHTNDHPLILLPRVLVVTP